MFQLTVSSDQLSSFCLFSLLYMQNSHRLVSWVKSNCSVFSTLPQTLTKYSHYGRIKCIVLTDTFFLSQYCVSGRILTSDCKQNENQHLNFLLGNLMALPARPHVRRYPILADREILIVWKTLTIYFLTVKRWKKPTQWVSCFYRPFCDFMTFQHYDEPIQAQGFQTFFHITRWMVNTNPYVMRVVMSDGEPPLAQWLLEKETSIFIFVGRNLLV